MRLKLNIIGRRRPGTTLAEHRHHIRRIHGEEVLNYIRSDPSNAPARYVQNVVVDGRFRQPGIADDPFALNRDFVTQIWVADFAALERTRSTEFYRTRLKDDEDRFVDQSNVVFLPCHERVIATRGVIPPSAWKVFVLFRRAPDVDPEQFVHAWQCVARSAGDISLRHVQNDVLHLPGGPLPSVDAVDEFWLPDEAAAYSMLDEWSALIERELVTTRLVVSGSAVSLLVREDVIHAGAVD